MERTVPIKNRVTGTSGTGTGGTGVYEPNQRNWNQPIIMSPIVHVALAAADTDETYGAQAAAEKNTFTNTNNNANNANNANNTANHAKNRTGGTGTGQ